MSVVGADDNNFFDDAEVQKRAKPVGATFFLVSFVTYYDVTYCDVTYRDVTDDEFDSPSFVTYILSSR